MRTKLVLLLGAIAAAGCAGQDFATGDPAPEDSGTDVPQTELPEDTGLEAKPDSGPATDTLVADSGSTDSGSVTDTWVGTDTLVADSGSDTHVTPDTTPTGDSGTDVADTFVPPVDTGPPVPVCGNSIVESGEGCDLGSPTGKCTGCETCQVRDWLTSASARTDTGSAALLPGTGEFCAEAWVRQDPAMIGQHTLMASSGVVPTNHMFAVITTPGIVRVAYDGVSSDDVALVPIGSWHHVAVCRHTETTGLIDMEMFVDGKFVTKTPTSASTTDDDFLGLGHMSLDTGSAFSGSIDEVRISNVTRYRSSDPAFVPARRFSTDSNTLGLYHLDGSGADGAGTHPLTVTGTFQKDTGYTSSMCL